MTSVFFRFQEHASEEHQDRVQKEILKLPGVRAVARISPDATKDGLRRLWYADVDDEESSDVVTRLRRHDDIQSADLPPKRGLL
jgi:cell division protein FtsX